MKTRLLQLSKGTIEYRKPDIVFGTEELHGILLPDKKLSMDVSVSSQNRIPMHLFFFSENPRVRITQPLSVGYSGKLTVELNTVGLMPGDTLSGLIRIVYNGGERELPYHFTIGMVQGGEADLSFMTLQDFVAFANENYEEAARIFFWKEFTKMPFMHDLHLMGLYHTFYSTTRQDAGLSAFLSACGYTVDFGNRAEKPENRRSCAR